MLVANVEGDVFSPRFVVRKLGILGNQNLRKIASRGTTIPPDKRGDLLLCGDKSPIGLFADLVARSYQTQIDEDGENTVRQFSLHRAWRRQTGRVLGGSARSPRKASIASRRRPWAGSRPGTLGNGWRKSGIAVATRSTTERNLSAWG